MRACSERHRLPARRRKGWPRPPWSRPPAGQAWPCRGAAKRRPAPGCSSRPEQAFMRRRVPPGCFGGGAEPKGGAVVRPARDAAGDAVFRRRAGSRRAPKAAWSIRRRRPETKVRVGAATPTETRAESGLPNRKQPKMERLGDENTGRAQGQECLKERPARRSQPRPPRRRSLGDRDQASAAVSATASLCPAGPSCTGGQL